MKIDYFNEIWKDIKDFEGLYQVSNFGRVRSLDRWVVYKDGRKQLFKGKILKPNTDKFGYFYISLTINQKRKSFKIHRLVAEAFLENPENLPCVNHKNEIKIDNRTENLEFCSVAYNNCYGTRLSKVVAKKINGKKSKPVIQYDLQGNMIKEYPSIREITRQLGFNEPTIWKCCKGITKTAKGFIWRYKNVA